MRIVELRCPKSKHGELVIEDQPVRAAVFLEVRCHRCSKFENRPITHVWNAATGDRLEDKGEKFAQAA